MGALPREGTIMNHTALVAIDLQRDFLEAGGRMPLPSDTVETILAATHRLLTHAEAAGWKVVFIRNEFRRSDRLGNFFRSGAALEGTPGAQIDPRVNLPPDAVLLSKSAADAFTNPALGELLAAASIRNLIVCGVMAEGCVRATVRSALRQNHHVTIVSDAIGSSREILRRFGLRSMQRAGAQLIESAELLRSVSPP